MEAPSGNSSFPVIPVIRKVKVSSVVMVPLLILMIFSTGGSIHTGFISSCLFVMLTVQKPSVSSCS